MKPNPFTPGGTQNNIRNGVCVPCLQDKLLLVCLYVLLNLASDVSIEKKVRLLY
jgi:hypothetical protein